MLHHHVRLLTSIQTTLLMMTEDFGLFNRPERRLQLHLINSCGKKDIPQDMADHTIQYLFNHIFLPTRVPQASELGSGSSDHTLVQLIAPYLSSFARPTGK